KHFNSKHDDATWTALFRRWHAGEPAPALRAEAGVSADTWQANAKRLGMRICDLAVDDPARRRVPAFEERDGAYHHPKSVLNERDWLRVLALREGGVRGDLLAEVFGVEHATICSQARARGLPPPHLARKAARDRPRPEMAFVFDRDDPEVTRMSLGTAFVRAVKEERYEDADALGRMWDMIVKIYEGMGGWRDGRHYASPGSLRR
ncbi:MAG: hypothetical protein Q8J71_11725, partial [Brevundimonas sp.]|nr:hypothetical protein [Brevundimonas sp.]